MRFSTLVLFISAILYNDAVQAQHVRLDGISLYFSSKSGKVSTPSPDDFAVRSRTAQHFINSLTSETQTDGASTYSSLAIDFDFVVGTSNRHEVSTGFAKQTLDATLFNIPGADTLDALVVKSDNEYFTLRSVYKYRLKPGSRIAGGISVEVGVPVSAMSIETQAAESEDFTFFAHRGALLAVGFPVGVKLKIFRAFNLRLGVNPTRIWTRLDGSRVSANMFEAQFGFFFRIRDRSE